MFSLCSQLYLQWCDDVTVEEVSGSAAFILIKI